MKTMEMNDDSKGILTLEIEYELSLPYSHPIIINNYADERASIVKSIYDEKKWKYFNIACDEFSGCSNALTHIFKENKSIEHVITYAENNPDTNIILSLDNMTKLSNDDIASLFDVTVFREIERFVVPKNIKFVFTNNSKNPITLNTYNGIIDSKTLLQLIFVS